MKTADILNMLGTFNKVYEDPSLTNAEKVAIGNEILILLPRPDFIPSVQASLRAVYRSISDRVESMEKADATRQPEAGRPEGLQETPGEQLLREAGSNGGRKGATSRVAKAQKA